MPWYCFAFSRTSSSSSKNLADSLVKNFAKTYATKRQRASSVDGIFTPKKDLLGHKIWYYLFAMEMKSYVSLIQQFKGKLCVPPPLSTLQHLAGDWLVPGAEAEFERRQESIPPPAKSLIHKDGRSRTG